MKKRRGSRGAVSVFLVIILVPCMLVSSIFVDVGRVYLGQGMADASADLALNTLMTNYDEDLNDWYGMISSCQNIDEFYEESAKFFVRAMLSQDLSQDEIILLSDVYTNVTGDDTISDLISDLIRIQTVEEPKISAVEGADLANATMLKMQVVDFMKYRAPITVTETLINTLKSDSEGIKNMADSAQNEPLVEAKKDFYETEGELRKEAFKVYAMLYQDYTEKVSTIESVEGDLEIYQSRYEEMNELYISNLCNTQGLSKFSRPTVALNAHTCSASDVCSSSVTDEAGNTTYYITWAAMNEQISAVKAAVTEFSKARTDVTTQANISYGKDTHDVQYWKQTLDQISIDKVRDRGDAMIKEYAKLCAMEGCTRTGDGFPDDLDTTQLPGAKGQVTSAQALYLVNKDTLGDSDPGTDPYLNLMKRLEEISSDAIDNGKIDPAQVTLSTGKTIGEQANKIAVEMTAKSAELEEYISTLETVNQRLNKLKDLAAKYQTTLDEWGNTAKGTHTGMAIENRGEISSLTREKLADEITPENVGKMIERLTYIIEHLNAVKKAYDTMSYGGCPVKGIHNYTDFSYGMKGNVDESSIGTTNTELKNYSKEVFQTVFQPNLEGMWEKYHEEQYDVRLNPETNEVAVPELYNCLHKNFKDKLDKRDQVESTEQDEKDAKKQSGEKEDEAKTGKVNANAQNITTQISPDGQTFSLIEGLGGVVDIVSALVDGNISSIRDDLYIGIYMREMFSYNTYNNEGKYELLTDSVKQELTKDNYQDKYKEVLGSAEKEGTWLSASLKDSYNKSMTNQMINETNNAAIECELEYILYGSTENKKNINAAYGEIYTIRYILNLVSAFQNFWGETYTTGKVLNAVATAVSGATGGIIPPQAIMAVLLPILTIFETCNDMNRLRAGWPVEIYKKNTDWQFSFEADSAGDVNEGWNISTVMNKITEIGKCRNPRPDKGIQYSDYLTLFLLCGLQNDELSPAMTVRMADVIQANMRKVTGNDAFEMSKSKVYFTLTAQERVEPIMVTLPIFSEYYDGELEKNKDWCTYDTKITRGY